MFYLATTGLLTVLSLLLTKSSDAQKDSSKVYLIGEAHSFLRNYIPENKIISQIDGPKIILLEYTNSYNYLLHDRTALADSSKFIKDLIRRHKKSAANEIAQMVANNLYQVIKINTDCMIAFQDIDYSVNRNYTYINGDSIKESILKKYTLLFKSLKIKMSDWKFLTDVNGFTNIDQYEKEFKIRVQKSGLKNQQKLLVFHFFQENYLLKYRGRSGGDVIRDSVFAKQITLLRELFPVYSVISINGVGHTIKNRNNTYQILKNDGIDATVYNIFYDHYEDDTANLENTFSETDQLIVKQKERKNMEMIDTRNCEKCMSDYMIYFDHPETIVEFTHFFNGNK